MKNSFSWLNLPEPFFCLAPMEGATDAAFRRVMVHCGRPQVMYTEFVNVEGLMSNGKEKLEPYIYFEKIEQPLIAQIWGLNPDNFFTVTQELVSRGFAGVDINMGCPDRAVVRKGAGGALINNRPLAHEIIEAVKAGAAGKIPVSVKIRIGYNNIITDDWAQFILSHNLAEVTVHGRTVKEQSKVPNHWDEIATVVKLRDDMGLQTVIVGNGDVLSLNEGRQRAAESGVDGIMIGRGAFHNPWVFNQEVDPETITVKARLELLRYHLDTYERLFGKIKPFDPLKRFFKIYIQGFPGAVELRTELMACRDYGEVRHVLESSQCVNC